MALSRAAAPAAECVADPPGLEALADFERHLFTIRNLRIVKLDGSGSDDGRGNRRVFEACEAADVGFGEGRLVAFVGANPKVGEIVPETGGVRKIRWALAGKGKRGGARVIYYYHNECLPVFLLSAYAKNRKANLSKAERNAMSRLVSVLVAGYQGNA